MAISPPPLKKGGNAIAMQLPAGMGDLLWLKTGRTNSGPEATRKH
jgi:hypothetical protein